MNVLHHVQVLKINENSVSILHDFLDGRKRITASRFEDQYVLTDCERRKPKQQWTTENYPCTRLKKKKTQKGCLDTPVWI